MKNDKNQETLDEMLDEMLARIKVGVWVGDTHGYAVYDGLLTYAPADRTRMRPTAEAAAAREIAGLRAEQEGWPSRTDCNRLDAAVMRLYAGGFAFLQALDAADADVAGEVDDAIREAVADGESPRSWVCYTRVNVFEALVGDGLRLRAGSRCRDAVCNAEAAREVIAALLDEGLEVAPEPSASGLIWCPSFRWLRRRREDGTPVWGKE